VDCGTSGGVWGLQRGYCLMIGGDKEVVEHLDAIFRSIAPGVEAAPRWRPKPCRPLRRRSSSWGVFSPLAETDRLTVMRVVSQPSPPEK
jgi:6-phosphogluconate dehydrogenase (decarboxylating)